MEVKKTCEIISSKRYFEESGWRDTYGIAYKSMDIELAVVEDISCDYAFVSGLAEKISNGDVAAVHFKDVIEDSLV